MSNFMMYILLLDSIMHDFSERKKFLLVIESSLSKSKTLVGTENNLLIKMKIYFKKFLFI